MGFFRLPTKLALAALMSATLALPACADEQPRLLPAPQIGDRVSAQPGEETAVLSGGCFWGMQAVFEHVKGVKQVLAGYSGGGESTAHYDMVSTGTTGHAESIRITFDPHEISYGEILRIFFSVAHDPTELNRQGPDDGTQYRSDIFFTDAAQKKIAETYIRQLAAAHAFAAPIVTRLDPFAAFYAAENYHQDYLVRNPDAPYIVYNDLPKIAALKRLYGSLYRDTPVTMRGHSANAG